MLTFNFTKHKINEEDGLMLDVGCGEGRHIFGVMQSYPNMKCIGIDPHKESLQKAEEGYEYFESISNAGAEFMEASAYSLPFDDNTFDLVVCSEVLEHLHQYNDAIKEVHRVLKKGGKFYTSVPASWPEKICWACQKIIKINLVAISEFLIKKILLKKLKCKVSSSYLKKNFIQYMLLIGG